MFPFSTSNYIYFGLKLKYSPICVLSTAICVCMQNWAFWWIFYQQFSYIIYIVIIIIIIYVVIIYTTTKDR